jgi:soluble lytic murein transglycosylase-like protein
MKLPIFALFLCVFLFASHFLDINPFDIHPSEILQPLAIPRRLPPAPEFTMNEIIRAASRKHQVKSAFIKSIIAAESGFKRGVVSPKGAIGLMQLMPATAHELGADPTVPEQNVEAGTHYLSRLLQLYSKRRDQLRWTIAAYNAGPGAVARYHGVPPYRETRAYVARVLRYFKKYQIRESRG